MTAATSLTWSPRNWAVVGAEHLGSAGRWWLRGFLALFPAGIAEWLVDRGSKRLVLSADQDMVRLELLTERRRLLAAARAEQDDTPAAIAGFLRTHKLSRADVAIGIRLPSECLFERRLLLPLETQRTLDAVVAHDLLAKTPFRADDIHHDHVAVRSGDKLCIQQWIVRRQIVSDAVEALGLDRGDLGFVETVSENDDPPPCVRLHGLPYDHGRWLRRGLIALAATACALAALAAGLRYHHQQRALDFLAIELSATRAKAQRVRSALDKLEAERASVLRVRSHKRDGPSYLDIWEEVTRTLPSHSWLTELRLSEGSPGKEQQIVMTGFSTAAASLVGLLERSPLLGDAALTAPISVDPLEGKERFAIQARLKTLDPLKTAAR